MKKYYIIFFACFQLTIENCFSQEIHFSQFYESPLILNPALTGYTDFGRIIGNYRRQAVGYINAYSTFALSGDATLFKNKKKNNLVGGGIFISNDRAGDGHLNMLKILFSASYHKSLDLLSRNNIAIGLQAGVVNKNVNINSLTFPNQYNDTNFDSNLPSGESFGNSSIYYPDISVGALWYYVEQNKPDFHLGIAFSHLNLPNESFLGEDNHIKIRYLVHGGTKIILKNGAGFSPKIVIIRQGTTTEINMGGNIEYRLSTTSETNLLNKNLKAALYVGGWYRISGTAIVVGGIEYGKWRLGANYDINVSSLSKDIGGKSAIEFAIIYKMNIKPIEKHCCPEFY